MNRKAVERLDKFAAELTKLSRKHGIILGDIGRVEVYLDEYRDTMDDERYVAFPQLYRGTTGEWELVADETGLIWSSDIDTSEDDASSGEDEG